MCTGGGMGGSGSWRANNLDIGLRSQRNRSGTSEGNCQSPCKHDLCLQYNQSLTIKIANRNSPTIIWTESCKLVGMLKGYFVSIISSSFSNSCMGKGSRNFSLSWRACLSSSVKEAKEIWSHTRYWDMFLYLRLYCKKNIERVTDYMVTVNSDLAGMYIVDEEASQPLPISMICKGGLMVTNLVFIMHLICNFSIAKALIAHK